MSRLLLYYGGELQVRNEFTPTYVGGTNRPLLVEDIIPLAQLKLRIISALRFNSLIQTVNLVCRIRNNGGYVATHVVDDEVCTYMLLEARRRTVTVYVEAEDILPIEAIGITTYDVGGPSTQVYRPIPIAFPQGSSRAEVSTTMADELRGRLSLCERPTFLQQYDRPRASVSEHRHEPTLLSEFNEQSHSFRPYVQVDSVQEPHHVAYSAEIEDDFNEYQTMDSASTRSSGSGTEFDIPNPSMEDNETEVPGHECLKQHAKNNDELPGSR
ncbi:hypothetical protein M5K25_024173 [Dendrobium thyrsiflorum]|uniref:Uncharacterized protein n=1 Tax=Dendrobium thyrsiflorum TaxID=117978 RepID=A0ABD0U1Q3_DENTH